MKNVLASLALSAISTAAFSLDAKTTLANPELEAMAAVCAKGDAKHGAAYKAIVLPPYSCGEIPPDPSKDPLVKRSTSEYRKRYKTVLESIEQRHRGELELTSEVCGQMVLGCLEANKQFSQNDVASHLEKLLTAH